MSAKGKFKNREKVCLMSGPRWERARLPVAAFDIQISSSALYGMPRKVGWNKIFNASGISGQKTPTAPAPAAAASRPGCPWATKLAQNSTRLDLTWLEIIEDENAGRDWGKWCVPYGPTDGTDKHRPGYIDNADKLPGNGNNNDSNGFCFFFFFLLFESVAKMLSAYIVLCTEKLQRV